jgi:hypothetical protein
MQLSEQRFNAWHFLYCVCLINLVHYRRSDKVPHASLCRFYDFWGCITIMEVL